MGLHFRAGLAKADSERVTDFLHLDWVLFHPSSYCQNFALDMIFIDQHAWSGLYSLHLDLVMVSIHSVKVHLPFLY